MIILCGKQHTHTLRFMCSVRTMFAHGVRQPSSQILFSYCAFESSISGAQRMRTPGGHGVHTEWRGGARRATQLRWWADRTSTIASQTVGQPLCSGCLSRSFSFSMALSPSTFISVPNKALKISHNWFNCTILTTVSKTFYWSKLNNVSLSLSILLCCTDGEPLEWQSKRGLQPTEPPGEAALHWAAEVPNGHWWHSAPHQSQWSQEHLGGCW